VETGYPKRFARDLQEICKRFGQAIGNGFSKSINHSTPRALRLALPALAQAGLAQTLPAHASARPAFSPPPAPGLRQHPDAVTALARSQPQAMPAGAAPTPSCPAPVS
jgi:hypothetical protein